MVTAVLLTAALAAAPAVQAAAPPSVERFAAYFGQGEALMQKGELGAAIWNFRKADEVKISPEVALQLARCHEKLGDPAYATYYYRLYLRRAPNASDALEIAERVGTVLAHAASSGRGLLEVDATSGGGASVGGQRFAEFPVAALLPPGDYELVARFPSGMQRRQVSIRTGKITALNFEPLMPPLLGALEPAAAPTASTAPTTRARPTQAPVVEWVAQPPRASPRRGMRVAAYVALGASAVCLLAGVVAGSLASADGARLKDDHATLTQTQAQVLVDSANGKGSAANVLWGVGGASALAGGALWLFSTPEPGGAR